MVKADISDMLILAFISGVTAILTSVMGISGTVLGAVVSSLAAEFLKTYFKEPVKDKLSEHETSNVHTTYYKTDKTSHNNYNIKKDYSYNNSINHAPKDTSHISTRALFLFPLVVILIIELIHFLSAINILPNIFVYSLESLTNWKLFRTIGYALIIMGVYPLISKKLGTHHGIILIIVGIIELIIGYADSNAQASMLFAVFSSLKEIVNIIIILAILYTAITVPDEINENNKKQHHFSNAKRIGTNNYMEENLRTNRHNRKFTKYQKNYGKSENRNYNKNRKFEDEDYFYYYEE